MKKLKKSGVLVLCILLTVLCFGTSVFAAKKVKVRTPTGLKADYDKNYINLKWKKQKKATGYIVYQYSKYTKKYERLGKTRKNTYNMSGKAAGTIYHFKVQSYRKVGDMYYKSKLSKHLRIRTKKEPTKKVSTIKQYLKTAMQPIGKAVYVWGGGWSVDGLGGSTESRSMGVSPNWSNFFDAQTEDYDYYFTQYQRHDGLDCSGYVGWTIYNIMNKKSGNNGYVMSAKDMARNYASRGWGTYIDKKKVWNYYPGDIMSSDCSDCGHVWIVVGECDDGSVVVLHSSSNAGVQLSGTVDMDGDPNSEAVRLVKKYMKQYFPEWCQKFKTKIRDIKYLSHFGQMTWDVSGKSIMTDPDGYKEMNAEQVLEDLLGPIV